MFKQLIQQAKVAISHESLRTWCRQFIEASIPNDRESEHTDLRFFQRRPDVLEEWFKTFSESLRSVASARTRREQLLEIRRLLLMEVETSCLTLRLLSEDLSDDDRRTLLAQFTPGESERDAIALQYQSHVFAEASCRCLRALAHEYGDTIRDDWFTFYVDVYGEFTRQLCSITLGQEPDTDSPVDRAMMAIVKETAETIKSRVLAGENWEYTPGTFQREIRTQER